MSALCIDAATPPLAMDSKCFVIMRMFAIHDRYVLVVLVIYFMLPRSRAGFLVTCRNFCLRFAEKIQIVERGFFFLNSVGFFPFFSFQRQVYFRYFFCLFVDHLAHIYLRTRTILKWIL